MKSIRFFLATSAIILLSACEPLPADVAQDSRVRPAIGELNHFQIAGVCDAFADVVIASIANIIQERQMDETKAYAERVANDLFRGFPEIGEPHRILINRFLQRTVTDQYLASSRQIAQQVETFKEHGTEKFRLGAANMCRDQVRTSGIFNLQRQQIQGAEGVR